MKNRMMKNVYAIILVTILLLGNTCNINVLAADTNKKAKTKQAVAVSTVNGVADFGRGDASIWICGNEGQTLIGKEFYVYQIFDAENAVGGESIQYTFCPQYETVLKKIVGSKLSKPADEVTEYMVIDYIQTMNNNKKKGSDVIQNNEGRYSEFRYFVEEVRNEIKAQGIGGDVVRVTSEKQNQSVKIAGLPFGYYIVDEVTNVQGTHSAASLCMVNTANPNVDIQIKSDYPIVEKKIQEDDNRKQIGNDGWNDIGDFEIGQTVPYQYKTKVPNMNGYDTYYFAWHDAMDQALTFLPDSVRITILDHESDSKKYELKKNEFTIRINPKAGETFQVQIADLKAIVDREFRNQNEKNENVYGQKIVLRYDAILNESAAEDTGRPGFENDVKLEFSNNPDSDGKGSTGETPWDTVVCFTYKLNGRKVNNHDKELADAKFRLYSNEDCTEEVYVKKGKSGYIVINRDSTGGTDHTGGKAPADAVEIVSDKNGIFTIYGLDGGTYWLKETDAPAGYRPILDPIRIQVIPTFTNERNDYVKGDGATEKTLKTLEYEVYIKQFLSGLFEENTSKLETNLQDGSGNLVVVNQVGVKLPGTGSAKMLFVVTLGAALTFYAIKKRGKQS